MECGTVFYSPRINWTDDDRSSRSVPWVPEFFFSLASLREADSPSVEATDLKPKTAQEKPLAPRGLTCDQAFFSFSFFSRRERKRPDRRLPGAFLVVPSLPDSLRAAVLFRYVPTIREPGTDYEPRGIPVNEILHLTSPNIATLSLSFESLGIRYKPYFSR